MADLANQKIAEADSLMWQIKSMANLKSKKEERRKLQKQALEIRQRARKDFDVAGNAFQEC